MPPDAPVSACDTDFSGMGIYIDGRVKNELDELLGAKPASDLTARDVHLIASMHYLDDQPMLRAAEFFGLTAKEDADAGGASKPSADATASPNATAVSATGVKTILDFGAGFAGDARCLASEYADARVTCVEVQRHIHDAAQKFTRLIGLGNVCVHECVDVFDGASGDTNRGDADANVATFARVPGAPFDFLYSVLVVLHVPQREALWRALHANLKPGALVYVEDYFAAQPLTARDREQLAGPVACPYLPSAEEYKETLERAGFENVEWEVVTHAWTPFIETRLAAFRANETRNLRVHGPGLTKELDLFYATVHELFTRGNVGGVRIRARKKA